jgi:hypothetical protein
MVAWTLKVFVHAKEPIDSFGAFYRSLSVHALPAWFACVIFFGTILVVAGLIIHVSRNSSEEVSEFSGTRSSLWHV